MSKRAVLEVIALGVEDAVAAQAGGADRLELVTDMAADGLTPSAETVAAIRAAVDIALRVMLRLADGFAAGDVDRLVRVAGEMREAGAEEFVLGFLDPAGGVDLGGGGAGGGARWTGAAWTFHRAIDRAADRDALRKQLDGLPGLDTYLTAGLGGGRGRGPARAARRGGAGRGAGVRAAASWSAAGCGSTTCRRCWRPGSTRFHIGGAARPEGWEAPVSAEAVAEWRAALDAV